MSRSDVQLLCGGDCANARPLQPFSEPVMAFLSDLGAALLKNKQAKAYPDAITFAFFCRRANLEALRAEYAGQTDDRLGRGLTFHIAPGNVPMNFAYSLAAALLAGNACVVKASSQDFVQTRIVCRAMDALFQKEHSAMADYVNVILYPRERQEITEEYSALCDARIIWGGDETVRRVRAAAIPPHAVEVTFPDRCSLLVIRPEAILSMDDKQLAQTAQGFYNDTYLTDQNACTSPRLIYWLGTAETVRPAQECFWKAVHAYVQPRYPAEPVVAVDKLTAAYRAAIGLPGAKMQSMPDHTIVRVEVDELTADVDEHRCAGGFFIEYVSETLDALIPVVKRRFQTLSAIGAETEELRRFVVANGLRGIDRIVPVGHTMDFSLTWDGTDLIRTLSRRITVF